MDIAQVSKWEKQTQAHDDSMACYFFSLNISLVIYKMGIKLTSLWRLTEIMCRPKDMVDNQ